MRPSDPIPFGSIPGRDLPPLRWSGWTRFDPCPDGAKGYIATAVPATPLSVAHVQHPPPHDRHPERCPGHLIHRGLLQRPAVVHGFALLPLNEPGLHV